MATPITWQNINAPSLADAARPLEAAQRSLNGSFDILDNLLRQREKTDLANVATIQNNEKQAYLDTLQSYKTPEELAAARLSGELEQRLAALDPNSRAAVRGADEARTASLMTQVTQQDQFKKDQLIKQYEPISQQVLSLAYAGKKDEALALMNANPEMPNAAQLGKAIVEGDRSAITFDQQTQKFGLDMKVGQSNLNDAATRRTLTGLQIDSAKLALTEAQRQAQVAEQTRNLERDLAVRQQQFYDQRDAQGKALGKIATGLGLPLDSRGHPRTEEMTTSQLKEFNASAKTAGLPTADEFFKGDTLAADSTYNALLKSGQYNPELIAGYKDKIRSSFDTTKIGGAVGSEARARDVALAENKVFMQEAMKNNWYAPGSPDARAAFDKIAKDVPNLINKTDGLTPDEDVAPVQALVYEMATRGLKLPNGQYVVPSVQDMENAIRTAEGGWFTDKQRANKIRDILQKSLSTPETLAKIAESEDIKRYTRKQLRNELLNKK